nr:hypothetical protein CKG001_00120 [Bdellovibrio sp. CKG001]BFD61332.1 hypothetical protein BdHM001_00130 [Bdellovibrio sp. HM001]
MKHFENRWIYEFFEEKPDAIIKSMFGGLALYYQGQLKLVIMEDAGNDLYRGKKYPYDIWNGLLICTSREQHPALQAQFPSLVLHPVLPKWLYVPFTSESWESLADSIIKLVRSGDPRIGVWPQQKKKKKVSRKKVSKKISTSRKTKRK